MKMDRRTVTWGIGGVLFGAPPAQASDKVRPGQMTLSNDTSSVQLSIIGYQFPAMPEDEFDANWLIVDGEASIAGRGWSFSDPCLMTNEVKYLADWLDACVHGSASESYCSFTEPNLQFELVDPRTLRISFSLESAPPWAKPRDDWSKHGFNVPVGPALSVAATALRNQLREFPPPRSKASVTEKRIFKRIVTLALLIDLGSAAWTLKDAIPLRGSQSEGSRFSVSIDDPYDDAHQTMLSNGYSLSTSEEGGLCVFRRIDATRTVHSFAGSGWPPGTVSLVEQDGKVWEIIWAFELTSGFL